MRGAFEYADLYGVDYIQVNSSMPVGDMIHMLKYDSVHGQFNADVIVVDEKSFTINGVTVDVFSQRSLEGIKWNDIDVVMECTGKFKSIEELGFHIRGGARRVVLSCPAADERVPTFVFGANEHDLTDEDVVSIGSCTTNALAPPTKVLHEKLGILNGFVSTVHAYTSDQNLLDNKHKDRRRARAAGVSMVPTSTGAAKAIHLVIPSLKGKLSGAAIRVPTPNVSVVDATFVVEKDSSPEEVNSFLFEAAKGRAVKSLFVSEEALVSVDYNHNPYSSIVDALETRVVGGNMVRILAWYDNEWAFSVRMLDMARLMTL